MDALLVGWGAAPVRETGYVLALRPAHQGRVPGLVYGS
jgi:hypothetical protein